MQHETALIAILATGLGFAFVFGFLAVRLGLPPLVGYLVAGVLVGPFTPGFVADAGLASQLAEIGVILLMFGVGLHFSPRDLMAVRGIAVPGAVFQIAAATALGAAVSHLWGWSWGSGLVFGLCLSVASTVVLLRALEDRGALDSGEGKHRRRLADRRGPLHGARPRAAARPLGHPRRDGRGRRAAPASQPPSGSRSPRSPRSSASCSSSGAAPSRGCSSAWRAPAPASCSRSPCSRSALGVAVGASALFGVSFALGAFFAGVVISESD